jgi:serine/threonine-protein kinase
VWAPRPPFDATSPTSLFKKVLLDDPPPLRSHNEDVSPELEAIVLRCLAKKPEDRYETAAALAGALRDVATT